MTSEVGENAQQYLAKVDLWIDRWMVLSQIVKQIDMMVPILMYEVLVITFTYRKINIYETDQQLQKKKKTD